MKKSLVDIWKEMPLKSDKGDVHDYLSVYEEILAPYRETAKNILEIGIFKGASLLLWEQYFSGKVYGIDCDEQPHGGMADLRPMIASGNHRIVIGNAENPSDTNRFFNGIKFDVVIEDAGHDIEQQLKIYSVLRHYMNDNSLYVIEDVQDIDKHKWIFQSISNVNVEILDRRHIKDRYDDVLILIRN